MEGGEYVQKETKLGQNFVYIFLNSAIPTLQSHFVRPLWVQLVPVVTNGSHLSVREYFLFLLNQKKVEHRSGWLSFSIVLEVDPQCGALCLSQHFTTDTSLLSEIYGAGIALGLSGCANRVASGTGLVFCCAVVQPLQCSCISPWLPNPQLFR